jgi:hypothetical protein
MFEVAFVEDEVGALRDGLVDYLVGTLA